MNCQVSEVEYCKLSIQYEADSDRINQKRAEVLREFKNVKMPGFRKGKASIDAIKLRCKAQIDLRLQQVLAVDAVEQTINEKNIKALGNPDFTEVSLQGDKFTCSFTLQKRPDFDLSEYKNFELPKPEDQISIVDFTEKLLQQIREQNAESLPYEDNDFVQNGDSAIVDYEVTIDGVPAEELTGTKELIVVGKSPIADFDDNLLGMKSGDVREFDIQVPADGPEQYCGKTLHFKLTHVMGSRSTPAPLNDALAQKLQLESLDDLRVKAGAMAAQKVEEYRRNAIANQVQKRLLANHSFVIPEWITLAEAKMQARNQKQDWETLSDEERSAMLSRADEAVRLTFVLDKIREIEPEAQLSDEEAFVSIQENLEKLSTQFQNENVDTLLQKMTQNGMLPLLLGRVRDEHTLNYIVKTSKIVD